MRPGPSWLRSSTRARPALRGRCRRTPSATLREVRARRAGPSRGALNRSGRSFILIDIPAQPEELKPFLVRGAILLDRSTEGSFLGIVQRRGEGSITSTAPMIHATIAAGRALLRAERDAFD